jgi:hypothetical protein
MAWNVSSCSLGIVFGICLVGVGGGVGIFYMTMFCGILGLLGRGLSLDCGYSWCMICSCGFWWFLYSTSIN